jgi:hypothetical protein
MDQAMEIRRLLPALPILLLPAAAIGQTAPVAQTTVAATTKPQDPSGIFDVQFVTSAGHEAGGRLVIRPAAGNFEGTIAPDGSEALAFSSIAFEKDSVVFKIAPPGAPGDITFHLNFDGPSLAGRFEGLESGKITGNKIR